jgi:hypothetical protein
MPPRHSFWVILIGKTATSFRGKEREDLVPTLRQLQRTQSDVTLRWFEGGRVWESPQAAEGAAKLAATVSREKRTREWRPGGDHRDPKARFELTRDQKRAKFKRDLSRHDESGPPARQQDAPSSPFEPKSERPRENARSDRPWSKDKPAPRSDRPWSKDKPAARSDRPWSKDRPPARSDRPWSKDKPAARSDRPWSKDKPAARSDRPWSKDKPAARSDRPVRSTGSPFPERKPYEPRDDRRDRPGRPPAGNRLFGDRPPRPSGPPMQNPFKTDRPSSAERPERPRRQDDRGGFKPPKRRS